jgi:transcriptional regulator with XRE-family HTH domain
MDVIFILITFVKHLFIKMKDRILEFLKAENKSSAQFAEEIGVQPSGISHILSGRNNPSLDFVLKMLEKYHFLSTEWLLFGRGSMYKDSRMQTLFEESKLPGLEKEVTMFENEDLNKGNIYNMDGVMPSDKLKEGASSKKSGSLNRIVWFFDDNSFEEFYHR